jgi:membrane protein
MSTRSFTFYRDVFSEAGEGWSRNNVLRLSAALAYYAVFSIAPLLIIAMSVAGWIFGPEAVRGQLDDQLRGIMGPVPAKAIQSMVQSASEPKQGVVAAIIGFVTLLIGASTVFGQIKDSLNEIWRVKAATESNGFGQLVKGFITARLLSFSMVLIIGFLLLVSLLLSTALAAAEKYAAATLPIPAGILFLVGIGVSVFMETILFMLIFRVLPDTKVQWAHALRGGFVTAVLFEIGKWLLGLYIGRESTTSSYGAAGSLIAILLWFYYTSLIFFSGAEFTQAWMHVEKGKHLPDAKTT